MAPPVPEDDEIAAIQARLAVLDAEKATLQARLEDLVRRKREPVLAPAAFPVEEPVTGASPPAAKIALFRDLFRGRDDVFPRRWSNPRTGKSGYSPVCGNEWHRPSPRPWRSR